MFPLFFQLLFLMRERECKYLSSFSLLFIYSINFWWIDVFFRKWKNIISTKVNRQYYGSLETDIICFMEKFVYETGSWTINLECHNGLYKCAVWTLFAKTLSPIVLDNFTCRCTSFLEYSLLVSKVKKNHLQPPPSQFQVDSPCLNSRLAYCQSLKCESTSRHFQKGKVVGQLFCIDVKIAVH